MSTRLILRALRRWVPGFTPEREKAAMTFLMNIIACQCAAALMHHDVDYYQCFIKISRMRRLQAYFIGLAINADLTWKVEDLNFLIICAGNVLNRVSYPRHMNFVNVLMDCRNSSVSAGRARIHPEEHAGLEMAQLDFNLYSDRAQEFAELLELPPTEWTAGMKSLVQELSFFKFIVADKKPSIPSFT